MKCATKVVTMLLVTCAICSHAATGDKFALHKLFAPHMVLQQEQPIQVFGTAAAGTTVTATFAGKTVAAVADASGNWLAAFPAMKAGTGYTLEVVADKPPKKLVINDVAIGEVWLCSGQSNMDMPVWSTSPFWRAANAETEVKNANWPDIREFRGPLTLSPGKEAKDLPGYSWQVCTPENVKVFTALGFFFARQLHKDMKVPIGIIHAARGGTQISYWMPWESFVPAGQGQVLDEVKKVADKLGTDTPEEMKLRFESSFNPWVKRFNEAAPENTREAASWSSADFDDSSWCFFASSQSDSARQPNVTWYRNSLLDVPDCFAKGVATLSVPAFRGTGEIYLNGKLVGKTDVLKPLNSFFKSYSFTIPEGVVAPGKNVIAIRLCDYGLGITKFNDSGCTRLANKGSGRPFNPQNWKMKTEYTVDTSRIDKCPELYDAALFGANFPGTLFNGMIAPLTRYPIRGVLWYQGESDSYFASSYYQKQRELIKSWRKRWNKPQMPFIIVQLAGSDHGTPQNRLPDDFWVNAPPINDHGVITYIREVQGEIGKLPNVGLITAIDVGDHSDAHPRDKQTLGFRAAKEAERLAYGQNIVSRGPTYLGMKVEGGKIRIAFDNLGGGLVTKDGAPPHAFAIAGQDGKYVWADAIIDGDTVVVSSPEVAAPVNVRYAWVTFRPDLNLCNKEGFPAFPFRSDAPLYK